MSTVEYEVTDTSRSIHRAYSWPVVVRLVSTNSGNRVCAGTAMARPGELEFDGTVMVNSRARGPLAVLPVAAASVLSPHAKAVT